MRKTIVRSFETLNIIIMINPLSKVIDKKNIITYLALVNRLKKGSNQHISLFYYIFVNHFA